MSAAAAFSGSQALWFISRASGLTLLAAFSAVVVLGVAARLGSAPKRWSRLALGELHRTLALFSVSFLGLHVATAISDPYVTIGWAATVLPFASPYRTVAIGLGTLAVDLGGAVLITSLVRRRLGYRGWRVVHWLAYLAWPVAFVHSITAGNDLRIWWVALVEAGCAIAVATAAVARLLFWWRGPTLSHRTRPTGVSRPKGCSCEGKRRPLLLRCRAGRHPAARHAAALAADWRRRGSGQPGRASGQVRAAARWPWPAAAGVADLGGGPGRADRPGRRRLPYRAQARSGGRRACPGGGGERHGRRACQR